MTPQIIRNPKQTENTLQQLTNAQNHLKQRSTYHKTQLTKHNLSTNYKLKPNACGEAKNANNDLLDHIDTTANMLAQEYETLSQRLQTLIEQIQQNQEQHDQLEKETTSLIDKIKNIF